MIILAIGVAVVLALVPATAGAATITVTTDVDSASFDDTGCGLREAIEAANTNAAFHDCNGDAAGADTIILQDGHTYELGNRGLGDGAAVDDDNTDGDLDIGGGGGLTIRTAGGGLATIDAGNVLCPCSNFDRVFEVLPNAGTVRFEGLKITHGLTNAGPGAVQGDGGGGILNQANLTVVDSEIVENVAVAVDASAQGGGIFNRGSSARLTMTGSTVAGNTVGSAGGAADTRKGTGGGIASYTPGGPLPPLGVNLTNVTISGNQATPAAGNPGQIGGLFTSDSGIRTPTTLNSVTITGNTGTLTGGIQVFDGTASGTIVAGNTDTGNNFPDCSGFPTSAGANILGTTAGIDACSFNFDGPGDLVPPDAANPILVNLGNLLNNGGPTRTHALNPGSPTIDRGGSCPATDQRGFLRGPVAPCDSGAFELNAPASLPVPPQVQNPPATSPPVTTLPPPAATGQRAAALKKCKKKFKKNRDKTQFKKCKRKALKLPV